MLTPQIKNVQFKAPFLQDIVLNIKTFKDVKQDIDVPVAILKKDVNMFYDRVSPEIERLKNEVRHCETLIVEQQFAIHKFDIDLTEKAIIYQQVLTQTKTKESAAEALGISVDALNTQMSPMYLEVGHYIALLRKCIQKKEDTLNKLRSMLLAISKQCIGDNDETLEPGTSDSNNQARQE
tara:strand:- start:30290 stop:30829 length:540 start_codon:yes stop_codon:yes gene_type:complete